jgi:DNA-binding IclR family transcriptional regulator
MQEENMKSLAKTFDILELYLGGKDEFAVTEVSKLLKLNKTTVSRIMSKLTRRGYLRQNELRGKYSLGTIFLEYSGIIKKRLKIRDIAIPHLFELSRKAKESTMLAVWDGKGYAITETFHDTDYSNSPLKVVPDEGITMPLYCTCLGKIFLAAMSDSDVEEYFKGVKLDRRTPNTVVDIKTLEKQLVTIRQEGVAFDDEEYALGVRGVAAGLVSREGKIAGSIALVAPSVRLSLAGMQDLVPIVKAVAQEISKEIP